MMGYGLSDRLMADCEGNSLKAWYLLALGERRLYFCINSYLAYVANSTMLLSAARPV
jgi:hypothetical protein